MNPTYKRLLIAFSCTALLLACGPNTPSEQKHGLVAVPIAQAPPIRDFFTKTAPGSLLWVAPDEDFNQKYGIPAGSTIVLPEKLEWIDVQGKMDGITFVAEKPVQSGHINFGEKATNIRLIGTLPGVPYGILIKDPKNFGLKWEATGDLELAGVEVDSCYMGIHLGSTPSPENFKKEQRFHAHDLYFHNTYLEAMYLGQDQLGGAFIKGLIERVKIRNVGNDGIQTRNGSFIVQDNDIDGTGLTDAPRGFYDHAHGILFGGNTKDGIARRNKLRDIGGFGIFANGYGTYEIDSNDIESYLSGVFTKNFEFPGEDLQKVGFQDFRVHHNKITAKNGKAIESYYKDNGCPVTVYDYANQTAGIEAIQPGVKLSRDAPTPDPAPIDHPKEKKLLWTASKTINKVTRKYNVYDDGTWAWK